MIAPLQAVCQVEAETNEITDASGWASLKATFFRSLVGSGIGLHRLERDVRVVVAVCVRMGKVETQPVRKLDHCAFVPAVQTVLRSR